MDSNFIGIRREDKNKWEGRVPLVPSDIQRLISDHGISVVVQPSTLRAIPDQAFESAGAMVSDNLSICPTIFAVKEIPESLIEKDKIYIYFSHVIKGQTYNMPMLRTLMEQGCTLIDYERMTDDAGRRLIFFGRFAGTAGMIDTLWAFGQRLAWEGIDTPFSHILPAHHYRDTRHAKEALNRIATEISQNGLSESVTPLIVGITGYGHVSNGAQEMLDVLPVEEISPHDIPSLQRDGGRRDLIYKSVFKEEDLVVPLETDTPFDLQDYYDHPERYMSVFDNYWPAMSIVVNAIYWDDRYPRLITKRKLRTLMTDKKEFRLKTIGDISCDIEGAMECTVKATDSDQPVYVYDAVRDSALPGVAGDGPVVMAVDNLPCELPTEASEEFSHALSPFVPAIAKGDYTGNLMQSNLPPEIRRAVIVWNGELTSDYEYLKNHLS